LNAGGWLIAKGRSRTLSEPRNDGPFSRSRSEPTQPPSGKARALKAAKVFSLQHPIAFAAFTGFVVAFTMLATGLSLIEAHGNGWPWWFHGIVIALITGFTAALLTWLYAREIRHHEVRMQAGERMSHEVCNALQILVQRTYLYPERRTQLEDEAIERIRKVTREILPDILDIPIQSRPQSSPPNPEAPQQEQPDE
jgi:hypothetical protein